MTANVAGRYRCPDCRARLWLPLALIREPDRPPRLVIREQEFHEAFARHIAFNPDRHPTFVTQE